MIKKLILLENEYQALEYLRNRKKFKDFIPMSFTFPVEKILMDNKIKFKTEEDYETESLYDGIYDSSIIMDKRICDSLKFEYKGMNLFQLYHYDTGAMLNLLQKYFRLLKEIIKKENPKEIIIFETNSFRFFDMEFSSKIMKLIFKGKIKIERYSIPDKKEKAFIKLADFMQKVFSRIKLGLVKKSDNKIFFSGSKSFFESIIKLLLKNKNNKMFRCNNNLQKSFFLNEVYIPFYKFSKKKCFEQKLKQRIEELDRKIREKDFSQEFVIEKELESILKYWLCGFINTEFLKVSGLIDNIIYLFKKNKIDLVLLDNDTNLFEKTLVGVCKLFKKTSIILQHGILGNKLSFIPVSADYTLVFGEEDKKWFVKQGVDKNKLKIIGCPRYDSFIDKKQKNKDKKILYITDSAKSNELPDHHLTKRRQKIILKVLFKILKKFPEYKLVIKLKPGWEMAELPAIIANQEKFRNLELIERTDNIKLVNDAEIVVIHQSSMGIEALLLDKPVISFSFKNLDRFNIYKNKGVVDVVYTEKQFERAIRKKIKQNKEQIFEREKFLKKQLYKLDGKSSERAVNFINKILLGDVEGGD